MEFTIFIKKEIEFYDRVVTKLQQQSKIVRTEMQNMQASIMQLHGQLYRKAPFMLQDFTTHKKLEYIKVRKQLRDFCESQLTEPIGSLLA